MSESALSKKIAASISRTSNGKIITWRNNVGVGIAISARGGAFTKVSTALIALAKKMGVHASLVKFGLCEGSSDRIGITPVTVTPEMVGMTLGVFTAIEVKTAAGKVSEAQHNFIDQVRAAGGFATVARSADEAIAACQINLF